MRSREMIPSEWSNDDWLTALKADRETAWAALRERVLQGLLAYLRRSRPGGLQEEALRGLADDAVQETLLTVRAKLDDFRNESRFTTWVHRIAVNALLGDIRRRRWKQRAVTDLTGMLPEWPLEKRPDPEREALQREMWAIVRTLIEEELTDHQRGILLAHVFDQKPLDLVAADLGISRDAAYKSIHDARRKLRAALLREGITLEKALEAFQG